VYTQRLPSGFQTKSSGKNQRIPLGGPGFKAPVSITNQTRPMTTFSKARINQKEGGDTSFGNLIKNHGKANLSSEFTMMYE